MTDNNSEYTQTLADDLIGRLKYRSEIEQSKLSTDPVLEAMDRRFEYERDALAYKHGQDNQYSVSWILHNCYEVGRGSEYGATFNHDGKNITELNDVELKSELKASYIQNPDIIDLVQLRSDMSAAYEQGTEMKKMEVGGQTTPRTTAFLEVLGIKGAQDLFDEMTQAQNLLKVLVPVNEIYGNFLEKSLGINPEQVLGKDSVLSPDELASAKITVINNMINMGVFELPDQDKIDAIMSNYKELEPEDAKALALIKDIGSEQIDVAIGLIGTMGLASFPSYTPFDVIERHEGKSSETIKTADDIYKSEIKELASKYEGQEANVEGLLRHIYTDGIQIRNPENAYDLELGYHSYIWGDEYQNRVIEQIESIDKSPEVLCVSRGVDYRAIDLDELREDATHVFNRSQELGAVMWPVDVYNDPFLSEFSLQAAPSEGDGVKENMKDMTPEETLTPDPEMELQRILEKMGPGTNV